MSDWSWKQAVAEKVLEIVNRRRSLALSLGDLYARANDFARRFPRNQHVREKIRQTAQRLRDSGFLRFEGEGRYLVNLSFPGIEGEPALVEREGILVPESRQVLRNVRMRDTLLAVHIKNRYGCTCQVCRKRIALEENVFYAEAHHLRPIGSPHFGPDVAGNIICLCPNHHIMFDRGALGVEPQSRRILQKVGQEEFHELYVEQWHHLDNRFLSYHLTNIFRRPSGLSASCLA
jgi:predicted HNH restriction endonuclease